jgi:uncharacterized protein (DUF1501 family)
MDTTLSRRSLLNYTAGGIASIAAAPANLAASVSHLIFSAPGVEAKADVLVCIFQRGGMDGLNAVIPVGDPDYYNNRPTLNIPEPQSGNDQTAIDLDGFFGLNPALQALKGLWDDQALAIVHACGSPDPTHSHFDAMDYMERGTPGAKQIPTGWLARHLQTAAWQNNSPFRAVGIGSMLPASLRGPIPATALESIAAFHLGGTSKTPRIEQFQKILSQLYANTGDLQAEAGLTFESIDSLSKINLSTTNPVPGAQYPSGSFGLALSQVAELIKAGVGLEIATVDIGGWDTHVEEGSISGQMPKLLQEFSAGLAAFYTDLGDRFKRVTVVTMSEFGRRVRENGGGGTDHGHGNVMFVVSKNINASKVYGTWPGLASAKLVAPGDLAVTSDYRDILSEILQKRLLNDHLSEIFPNYTQSNNLNIFKSLI